MKNNTMVEYKTNIFTRIKNKIKSLFLKEKNNIQNNSVNDVKETADNEKARIMDIYARIKQDESEITNVSEDDLYKIMLLLNEEITIVNGQMNEKAQELDEKTRRIKIAQETA